MRVLFWTLNFWPNIGGLEVLAAKLLPALRDRGYEFLVVTPKSPPELPDEGQYRGVPIKRLPFHSANPEDLDHLVEVRRKVAEIKRAFAPDLIHVNGVGAGAVDFFHQLTTHTHKAPSLVTLHGDWDEMADPMVGRTLREASWVTACSQTILERGRSLVPEVVSRSSVVYNGMETPSLAPTPLSIVPPRILSLGRLSPEKGMDLALLSFVSILDRFPSSRLTIAGEGPSRHELQQKAVALGIHRSVDFVGWVAPRRVPSLINAATMVLVPSRHEGFGLVALEAAIMARPVVATRVGGLPEIVVDRQTGLLVGKDDSGALAEAVTFLIDRPDQAIAMGKVGRIRARQIFTLSRCIDAYHALYRQLVS